VAGMALTPVAHRPRSRYRGHQLDEGVLGFGPRGER
jgi:hypothetical protein